MLDFRMKTFLQLCETMNYRKTAQLLNMTQPSVTQHIKFLEKEYNCSLFLYDGHSLNKTEKCRKLERKIRSMYYLEKEVREELAGDEDIPLRIGATKTIAEYILPEAVKTYLKTGRADFTMIVENTEILLRLLDETALDFALIEGVFDKASYGYRLLKKEKFLGICSLKHPFAGREIDLEELFSQDLIIREEGSGTRNILEEVLKSGSHSIDHFQRCICISQFSVIRELVAEGLGITFAYESLLKKGKMQRLKSFTIKDMPVVRELNFVYLEGTQKKETLDQFGESL